MLTGINHITLSVKDLEESFNFYVNILGFKPIAKWERGIYLTVGETWIALFLDKNIRKETLPEYTHIAFGIDQENFKTFSKKIRENAVIFQENTSEGDSLYFIDPNGHKLEIHVSDLNSRIKSVKEKPYKGMVFFD